MIHALIYGVILAFGLIIPLGVQNIFILNQGASQRHFFRAMPSVITAAFCDSLLIVISVLGVSAIVLTIPWLETVIYVVGFCFLMYMGWVTWKSKPEKLSANANPCSAKRQIVFAASVSLLNPHALLDTVGVIGTNSLQFYGEAKWIYTLACIFVSWCWFFGLSMSGDFLHKLDKTGLWVHSINKISAFIIWGVAIYIAYQLLRI